MATAKIDYTRICFVIMPFGKKKVGDSEVDFDFIYDQVFAPAVQETSLPEEGGLRLLPKRTDKDFFAGDISQEMFEYLEYSRFAVADISGLNANVFYELGVRHRAHEAGTAVFRQAGSPIPFDINTVKAFDYEYQPADNVPKARQLITRVLTESLRYNRLDSPVQRALLAQRGHAPSVPAERGLDELLRAAENAIRGQEWAKAIDAYREAVGLDPRNCALRLRLGLFLKDRGRWADALGEFTGASVASPRTSGSLKRSGPWDGRTARPRFARPSSSTRGTTMRGRHSAACSSARPITCSTRARTTMPSTSIAVHTRATRPPRTCRRDTPTRF